MKFILFFSKFFKKIWQLSFLKISLFLGVAKTGAPPYRRGPHTSNSLEGGRVWTLWSKGWSIGWPFYLNILLFQSIFLLGTGLEPVTPNHDNELCIRFDLGASQPVATPAGGNLPSQTLKPPHLQNYNTNTRAKNGVCFQKNTTKKHKNNILCLNKVKVY